MPALVPQALCDKNMIKLESIILERGEGPKIPAKVQTFKVQTFKEADAILLEWSQTAPELGGYDKCFFQIEYEDGYKYQGRYDLKHITKETPDLSKCIKDSCEWTAGRVKNPHCGLEKYGRVIKEYGVLSRVSADFLDNYQIGDDACAISPEDYPLHLSR